MALLFEEDYKILEDCGLFHEEDETNRFLVLKNYPLPSDLYINSQVLLDQVEVLLVIPPNYNTSGNDMFWVHPALARADGKTIPAAAGYGGGDSRFFDNKEFCRWSRHYTPQSWNPKVDNIQKMIDRIEWALRNPDANK